MNEVKFINSRNITIAEASTRLSKFVETYEKLNNNTANNVNDDQKLDSTTILSLTIIQESLELSKEKDLN